MLPSAYPEVGPRSALRELLRVQVDMQLADLRTLLCLPRDEPGLDGGCNLTAATLAANIIAGASVLFWNSSLEELKPSRDRGKRFTGLMTAHYPWSPQDAVDAELGAKLLWDHTRNPLSHTLGVGKQAQLFPGIPTEERGVWLLKPEHGLAAEVVEELMSSYERPHWMSPTVISDPGGYAIHVDTLAWGVTRMLRNLFADTGQANAAEATARVLLRRR
jgi:hypothetical protein